MQNRYHIHFGNKRTTIKLDSLLADFLAIKLGYQPDDTQAHRAVRTWLQEKLVAELGDNPIRKNASQWARRFVVREIVDRDLSRQWKEWLLDKE